MYSICVVCRKKTKLWHHDISSCGACDLVLASPQLRGGLGTRQLQLFRWQLLKAAGRNSETDEWFSPHKTPAKAFKQACKVWPGGVICEF